MVRVVADIMLRILLVDDDGELRSTVAELLRDEGYDVLEEPSGEAGLARLERDLSLDLILLDYRLPGLDGGQVFELLRERGNATPVILVTSSTAAPKLAKHFEIPFHLSKPFGAAELLDIVHRATDQRSKDRNHP